MNNMIRSLFAILIIYLTGSGFSSQAAINAYEFADEAQRQRFHALTNELRCPKCQNQAIADSDAPLAQDLRQRVYEMIQQGQNDNDIIDFMVRRYGDFITYRPPLKASTWLLWFGPWILLLGAFSAFGWWIRRRPPLPTALTEAEQQRLHTLLATLAKPSQKASEESPESPR